MPASRKKGHVCQKDQGLLIPFFCYLEGFSGIVQRRDKKEKEKRRSFSVMEGSSVRQRAFRGAGGFPRRQRRAAPQAAVGGVKTRHGHMFQDL